MKVKIVKARRNALWYSTRIGELFDVQYNELAGFSEFKYVTQVSKLIYEDDCEIVEDTPLTQQFRIMRQKAPGKKYKTRGTILHTIDEAKSLLKQLRENFPQYKYILVEVVEGDMDV